VKSDDVRGKQFSTHRPGYDEKRVDAFLKVAALRLAAMESTDRPAEPLVSGAIHAGWAEWADSTTFRKPRMVHGHGYTPMEVDAFRKEIRDTFLRATKSPVRAHDARGKQFSIEDDGYDIKKVAAFLHAAGIRLAAMESTDRPAEPLVSDAIHAAGWAAWADSTRFSTSRRTEGYDTAEVDAFLDAIRDTFHGVRPPPLTWRAPHGKQFTTTQPGYDVEQVDAFLDMAESRLAALRATDQGRHD
jgi:DivIVA domain-containing protein